MGNISILLDFKSGRIALRKDNFSEVEFNKDGAVSKFKYSNKVYVKTYHEGTTDIYGYLEQQNYEKLRIRLKDKTRDVVKDPITSEMWRAGEFTKDQILAKHLKVAQIGDVIEGCFEYVGIQGICKQYYLTPYTGVIPSVTFFKQPVNIDILRQPFECRKFDLTKQSGKFFDAYKDYPLFDGTTATPVPDPALVGEIALLLESMDKVVYDSWNEFLGKPYSTSNFYKDYSGGVPLAHMFSRADFISYRNGLQRWLQLLKDRQDYLKKVKDMEHGKLLMLLFTMNREAMLRPLTVQIKIKALTALVTDHALAEWFFSFSQKEFFDTEDLAMNLINSVTTAQATDFLDLLEQTHIKQKYTFGGNTSLGTSSSTAIVTNNLYIVLFRHIDDIGGMKNFTLFANKISELVAIKHNVQSLINSHPGGFSKNDLKTLQNNGTIVNSFFWKEKGLENKTAYDIKTNSIGDKLTIEEKICKQVKLVPHIDGDGMGPSMIWYSEECAVYETTPYPDISHFDLVFVYFYDHPSFIDLRGPSGSYEQKCFFTFAGFFYYLQVKEASYWTLQVFNACLFAIPIVSSFAEIVIALRGLSYLQAIVGLSSLIGNTSLYITSNTSFVNYIIQNYPDDPNNPNDFNYNDIIYLLNLASLLSFTPGANNAPSSLNALGKDVVNATLKSEMGKYLGAARELIKDEKAMALLTAPERKQFVDLTRKIESELYELVKSRVLNAQEILKQQSSIIYYKFVQVRAELNLLSTAERTIFLEDFATLEGIYKTYMEDFGAAYIRNWKNFSNLEKAAARLNPSKAIDDLLPIIRYETKYGQPFKVKIADLTNSYLISKYHPHAVNLRNQVQNYANAIRGAFKPGRSYGGRASVVQYYDKVKNMESEVLCAFTAEEVAAGAVTDIFANVPGTSTFNPSQPYLQPNFRTLIDELIENRNVWIADATVQDKSYFYDELFRHADLRGFNDLACKRWGTQKLSRTRFDEWCSNDILWHQELLRASEVNGIRVFITHDPCRICYYPTLLINKIK